MAQTTQKLAAVRVLGGRWELQSLLARGGMGVLYVGQHLQTGRRAAIKVIEQASEEMLARFRLEASVCAQIAHPGVVDVFDADLDPAANSAFIAMELLEGCTLRDVLDDPSSSPERVIGLLMAALEPLAAAHAKGFVHRDLKPENLFVLAQPHGSTRVKLLDFGIVAHRADQRLTRAGMAMGTPHYMSPEQAMSARDAGPASDVWAMGVMLYEAIKGDVPFDGETSHAVIVQALTTPHMPLGSVVPGIAPELAQLIDSCLEKQPEDRPADAAALLDALHRVVRPNSLPPVRPSLRSRSAAPPLSDSLAERASSVRPSLRVRSVKNAANILAASGVVCSLSALALPFTGVGAPVTAMLCAAVGGGLLFTASARVNALQRMLQLPPANTPQPHFRPRSRHHPHNTESRQSSVVLSQRPKPVLHPLRGRPEANVRVELYADLSCAISRRVCQRVMSLRAEHADNVSVVFRPFWDPQREMAPATAELARCLFEREGAETFWAFFDLILVNSKRVTNALLLELASQVSSDMHGLQRALRAHAHRRSLQLCRDEADSHGVDQSPTVRINGVTMPADLSEDRLRWAYVDAMSAVEQRRKVELGETRAEDGPSLSGSVAVHGFLVRYRGARNAPPGLSRTREQARERAQKLGERARMEGEDFTNVALRFADALLEPEELEHRLAVPVVADEIIQLEVGEMSKPLECDEGFQVLQRIS